jgi:hypothetical protein
MARSPLHHRRVAQAAALAWLAVAVWRFLLAVGERATRFGVQACCALVVAGAILGARDAGLSDEPRLRRTYLGLLALGLAGFALVFAQPGLLAFGGAEN